MINGKAFTTTHLAMSARTGESLLGLSESEALS